MHNVDATKLDGNTAGMMYTNALLAKPPRDTLVAIKVDIVVIGSG